jgi:hypothetical protein
MLMHVYWNLWCALCIRTWDLAAILQIQVFEMRNMRQVFLVFLSFSLESSRRRLKGREGANQGLDLYLLVLFATLHLHGIPGIPDTNPHSTITHVSHILCSSVCLSYNKARDDTDNHGRLPWKKAGGLCLNQMTPAPYAQIDDYDLTPPASAIIKSNIWI